MATEDVGIRARLIGARQYIRDVTDAARAQQRLAQTADAHGVASRRATHHMLGYNQAIFTTRRLLFGLTVATGSAAAAAIAMGFNFNKSVERTTVALAAMSHGQFDATEQTKQFLRIARDTAFLPQQVIEAGQSFIGFGFSATMANRTLKALGYTMGTLNLPVGTMDRVIFALGQIQVKGRLMGEELRQLANANIPAYKYLSEAFGENVTQLNKIGDARIPAELAINAIVAGMERDFTGAGKKLQDTTSFQIEVLKGDLQAIFGTLFMAPFAALGSDLRAITTVTGQMFDAILAGAGPMELVQILDDATGGAYHLVTAAEILDRTMRNLWRTGGLLVDAFTPTVQIIATSAYILLLLTNSVLDFINLGGDPLLIVLQLLVAWWTAEFLIKRISIFWGLMKVRAIKLELFWTRRLIFWTRGLTFANGALAISTMEVWSAEQARYIQITKMGWLRRLITLTYGLATATFTLSIATWSVTLPVALVILAVAALAAGLIYLYYKYDDLRGIIGVVTFLIFPLIGAVMLLAHYWNELGDAIGYVSDKLSGVADFIGGAMQNIPGVRLAGMGLGFAGDAVGGAGNLLSTPGGGQVAPVAGGAGAGMNLNITPADVNIDGKKLAEIMFDHRLDRMARR